MAKKDVSKKSTTEIVLPQAPVATLQAVITGVGNKRLQVPVMEVEAILDRIARQGLRVQTGPGKSTVYMPMKIEKINIVIA